MVSFPILLVYIFFFISLYIQVFLLITFLEYREWPKREKKLSAAKLPSVTVIVPCYNEAQTLCKTVRSLLSLRYPKRKLLLLIVDDGSTDGTRDIARRFEKYGNVRVLGKENGGKHTALNLGLEYSDTELVGCLDADSFVHPDALLRIVALFNDAEVMAVTPAIHVRDPKNFIERIQHVEYTMGIFLRKMFGMMNAIHVAPGPFSIFRKEVFERIGVYRSAHQTEDLEIALRMHTNRLRIENAENAFVYTTVPSTLPKLLRQRKRWITGFLRNAYDYRGLFFRPKFGNIGFFTLPGGVLAILSVCYLTLFSLVSGTTHLIEKISDWRVIHFDLFAGNGRFDLFYIHPHASTLLTLALLSLGLIVIILSKQMADEKEKLSKYLIHFLFLYGLMAPVWILNAVGQMAIGRKTRWK